MRKISLAVLLTSFVLGSASISFAQTDGGSTSENQTKTKPPRERMMDASAAREQAMTDRMATSGTTTRERMEAAREQFQERREALTEKRKELIKRFAQQMFHRINAAVERLWKLSERIESRIEKLNERGVDTAAAEALLETAQAEITKTQQDLEDAKALAETVVDAEDPKEAFQEVRALVQGAKESVKNTHRALVASIEALKGSLKNETATTTTQ